MHNFVVREVTVSQYDQVDILLFNELGQVGLREIGMPFGYIFPERSVGYVRPSIPGICVAVKATTS